jgi:hypothetical protein
VVRSRAQRVADTRGALERATAAWVATASPQGRAHLVPLDVVYDGTVLRCATVAESATARNLAATRTARVAVGDPADVVMVDVTASVTPWPDADRAAARSFVEARGWDPADEPGEFVLLELRPTRVQAWNSVEEIAGRTVLRDGVWLDGP